MLHFGFDQVAAPTGLDRLPLRLEQSVSRGSVVSKLLLLVPALAAVAIPLFLVAAHAVAEPSTLGVLRQHPLTALQIALGLALWSALFVYPLRLLLARAATRRLVHISPDRVAVIERGLLGTRAWSAPLDTYRGIARCVRSSMSGVRHELVLVHADPRRHVLLQVGDTIPQSAVDKAAALLRLPEVPVRSLHR
jgi:hypothetical protein